MARKKKVVRVPGAMIARWAEHYSADKLCDGKARGVVTYQKKLWVVIMCLWRYVCIGVKAREVVECEKAERSFSCGRKHYKLLESELDLIPLERCHDKD